MEDARAEVAELLRISSRASLKEKRDRMTDPQAAWVSERYRHRMKEVSLYAVG
jgi:hypothetical protein